MLIHRSFKSAAKFPFTEKSPVGLIVKLFLSVRLDINPFPKRRPLRANASPDHQNSSFIYVLIHHRFSAPLCVDWLRLMR